MALNEDKGRLTEDIIADELKFLEEEKRTGKQREFKHASGADLLGIFFDDKKDHSKPFLIHGYSYAEYSRLYKEYMAREDWKALAALREEDYTPELVAEFKRDKVRREFLSES